MTTRLEDIFDNEFDKLPSSPTGDEIVAFSKHVLKLWKDRHANANYSEIPNLAEIQEEVVARLMAKEILKEVHKEMQESNNE